MTALSCDRVRVERGRRRILDDFSLHLEAGRAVAILGPNGAGKSTALGAALGLIPMAAGAVTLDGRPLAGWSRTERAGRLAWLPQDAPPQEPLPAWEWVAAARYRFAESWADAQSAAHRVLMEMGIAHLAERVVTTLSGGERQRVALAALFAQDAEIILADEPASHLDPAQQLETYARLGRQVRSGRGLLIVTHDVNLLPALDCPVEVVGLREGRTAFTSPYPGDRLVDGLEQLFGVTFDAVAVAGRTLIAPRVGAS